MSVTLLSDVQNQVGSFWSNLFVDELKENTLLPALVNKDYDGELNNMPGDTVYVSQINRPTAERKSVGSNHEYFSPTKMSTSRVSIQANQVISAAFDFDDLVGLQSQIKDKDSEIRKALLEAVEIELNSYLYGLVSPSTSAPDHTTTGVTDFNATQLGAQRVLAANAKWSKAKGWYGLLSPAYYQDMLNAATMTSKDYIEGESPVIGGQLAQRRFGFNLLEDNSAGMDGLAVSGDGALLFHPDFMYLVMPKMAEFKVSDNHSNNQFGYKISVRMVCGAALGLEGANKHITVTG